jgi:hypothetical protein
MMIDPNGGSPDHPVPGVVITPRDIANLRLIAERMDVGSEWTEGNTLTRLLKIRLDAGLLVELTDDLLGTYFLPEEALAAEAKIVEDYHQQLSKTGGMVAVVMKFIEEHTPAPDNHRPRPPVSDG